MQLQSGNALYFGVSGRLWRDTLIMFDRETRSLWSQLQGKAVWGDMAGVPLEKIPSVRTSWREWKRLYPHTLALKKPAEVQAAPYAKYFSDANRLGVTGRKLQDDRLPGKSLVYGLEHDGDSLAVPLREGLSDLVKVQLASRRIWVVRDGEEAVAWESDDPLEMRDGQLVSPEGNAVWDSWTGKVRNGPAEPLRPVDGFKSYWFTWVSFHPDTGVAGATTDLDRSSQQPQTRPQTRPAS